VHGYRVNDTWQDDALQYPILLFTRLVTLLSRLIHTKEEETNEVFDTCERDGIADRIILGKPDGNSALEIEGKIMLNWILKKQQYEGRYKENF
jgi:hypothetical protein